MPNIFLIHGAYGHPNENWFPWLKQELTKLGHTVYIPKFPTPKNQSLENWQTVFKDYEKYIDINSIFIGHSLGPAFILNILENLEHPIKASFFIAGFTGLLNNPEFDQINQSFTDKDFNWNKIKRNCQKFHIYHSDSDPYVPISKAKELAKNLNTKITEIPNAGHFNENSGYTKFKKLLVDIKNYLTPSPHELPKPIPKSNH